MLLPLQWIWLGSSAVLWFLKEPWLGWQRTCVRQLPHFPPLFAPFLSPRQHRLLLLTRSHPVQTLHLHSRPHHPNVQHNTYTLSYSHSLKANVAWISRRNSMIVTRSALSFGLTCSCFLRFRRRWNRCSSWHIRKRMTLPIIHSIIDLIKSTSSRIFNKFARPPSSWLCVSPPSVWPSPLHSNPPLHLMHPKQTDTVERCTLYLHPRSPNNAVSVWHHLFTCDKVASSLGSGVAAPQSICSCCCWTGGPSRRRTYALKNPNKPSWKQTCRQVKLFLSRKCLKCSSCS